MQKSIVLFLIAFIIYNNADSQITKGNWMVGGSAGFSFTNSHRTNTGSKATNISLAPDIGYFFIDKLAAGARLTYNREHTKYSGIFINFQNFTNYSAGPFVRYYLLPKDQQYNILSEASYQFGSSKTESSDSSPSKGSSICFTFSAGPVIYFNTSVGIEFLLTYKSKSDEVNTRSNSFGLGIGLQIHLQKDKN
jgi:hypothetical protein